MAWEPSFSPYKFFERKNELVKKRASKF